MIKVNFLEKILLLLTPIICTLFLLFSPQDLSKAHLEVYGAVTQDPLSFTLILHRMSENILNFHSLWDGKIFYPYSQSLALSEPLFLSSLFYRFFYLLTSQVILSLNLTLVLFFLLNYFAMFFLSRLILKPLASIVAATIFSYSMLRLGHLCHIHLLPQFIFPITLFFIVLFEKKQKNRYLLFSILALSAQFYFSLALGILLFVSLLPYFVWKIYIKKISFKQVLILALSFIATSAPLLYTFYKNSQSLGFYRTLSDGRVFRASPLSYFTPPANHFYEKIFSVINFQDIARQEKSLFIGFLCLTLTLLGFYFLKKEKNRYFPILAMSFIFVIVISMGSYLGLYNILFYLIPLMKGLRTPARFALSYLFICSLLSGYAFEKISQKTKKIQPLVFILFLFLFLIENRFRIPKTQVYERWADSVQFLAITPKKEPTIFFPMDYEEAYHMYASTLHNHPIANGWAGFTPESYYQTKKSLDEFISSPTKKTLHPLINLGFKNLAIRKDFTKSENEIKKIAKVLYEDEYCFIIYLEPL
jgi:hypothetical protein